MSRSIASPAGHFIRPLDVDDPPAPALSDDASGHVARLLDSKPERLLEFAARLAAANIRTDRHGSPDLIQQLRDADAHPVAAAVCVVLDDDPTLNLQASTVAADPLAFWLGATWLSRHVRARRSVIVHDVAQPLPMITTDRTARRLLPTPMPRRHLYPLADPSVLALEIFKVRLRPGFLPTLCGLILYDAVTAIAIGRLFAQGEGMTHAPVSYHDGLTAHLLSVPIGTTLRQLLVRQPARAEGRVWQYSPLRRFAADLDAPIGQGALTYHVLPPDEPPARSCVRCGWCMDVCPVRCQPASLLDCAQRADADHASRFGLAACVECGLCQTVCPSQLPLLDAIRSLRRAGRS